MFQRIGTNNLDFHSLCLCAPPDFEPGLAGYRQRINRVRDHGAPDTKVIVGDSVGHAIACVIERRNNMAIPERLLNRVDTYVNRADLSRQFPSNACLPYPWQARKDD